MASTRHNSRLVKVFQDQAPFLEDPHFSSISSDSSTLQPVQNGSSSTTNGLILDPPPPEPNQPSPLKASRSSTTSPPKAGFNNKFIMIPQPLAPKFITDSPRKKPSYTIFDTSSNCKPQKALFTTFSSIPPADKENYGPPSIYSDTFAEFPHPSNKTSAKRVLLEAAPIHERNSKKQKVEEIMPVHIPQPEDMPAIEDDGGKPPYSYAMLIGMSILRAPNRRLTLAQIYKWISDTFCYYQCQETGWQNSIRHNLSLNKAFVKQERPKDDPGKGNYWIIESGMEAQFVKDKMSRRPTATLSDAPAPIAPRREKEIVKFNPTDTYPTASTKNTRDVELGLPQNQELSSDATIPASDLSFQDFAEDFQLPPPSSNQLHSSPPPIIHSSPPIPRNSRVRGPTPPPVPQFPSSSNQSRLRKRRFASMNDSGYFSSLESSALRPYNTDAILTSDADLNRHSLKRGRAEEEIARIRHSSNDISPTKSRTLMAKPVPQLISSSPIRQYDNNEGLPMLPPLTPGMTFKMPQKPPQSISPNTNLRNHRKRIRELVGSPVHNMGTLDDFHSWSPSFNMENEVYSGGDFDINFNVYADYSDIFQGSAFNSPVKQPSSKRPKLDRAATTASILSDITASAANCKPNNTNSLGSKTASLKPSPFPDSPTKSNCFDTRILDLPQKDMFSADFSPNEPEFTGVDILQGFRKIGGVKADHEPPKNTKDRRGIGRSLTSRF
ncbi:MAG: hypothetical protein M1829_005913 [Trizodia sp. TS-e1964]|nr:MAG: hypothetical protein M1829_005913 [Trizodia sp. TS-e1964]